MRKLKVVIFLLTTLIFSYILSEVLVYGSNYIANLVDIIVSQNGQIGFSNVQRLTVVVIIGFLSAFLKGFCSSRFSLEIVKVIKEKVMVSILEAKVSILSESSTGALINKFISDVNSLEQYLGDSFPKIISSLIITIVVGRSFYKMSVLLIIEVSICCLLIMGISFFASKKLSSLALGRKRRVDMLLSIADDFLKGIMTGRSYNLFPIMKQKIDIAADEILYNEYQRTKISSYSWLLQTISEWMPAFCLFGIIFLQGENNEFSVGEVTYLILMMNRLFKPFSELPALINETAENVVSLKRIIEIVNYEKEDVHEKQRCDISRGEYAIELNDLGFSYGANAVLNQLSLSVEKGEEIAIVGSSGGGKSTIFKILCGFLEHIDGEYKLFGKPMDQYSLKEIRKQFAVVFQDAFLFPGTIYENIICGYEQFSEGKIIEVCKLANIHDDIKMMEHGYQTVIGAGGVSLSGGEKQRISLARALLRDAPILLLDEPTAALDIVTEQSVRKALDLIKGRKTIIMIAHRLSTVKYANRIIVLHRGGVAETGGEDELMKKRGIYYNLKLASGGDNHD